MAKEKTKAQLLEELKQLKKKRTLLNTESGKRKNIDLNKDFWPKRIKLISVAAGQLIYAYDIKSGSISWNGDVRGIFGYSIKAISDGIEQWTKLIHPEDLRNTIRLHKNAEKTSSPFETLYRVKTKNNKYITIFEWGFYIPAKNGKAIQRVGFLSESSPKLSAGEKSKESEVDFLSVVNEMPHYIYRINLKGELTFANDIYCKEFGFKPSEIIGKTAYDLHPKELADKYFADDKKVFRTNKTFYTIEENVNKLTGKKEIVEVFKIPLRGKTKKVIGLQGVYWNITERFLAQKKMESIESNYKEIFNATGEAIFIHNALNGKILDVNETATKMYGYTKEEMCALSINELSAGDNVYNNNVAAKNIEKAPLKGSHTFEWRAKKKNGNLFWVEVALRKSKIGGKGRVLGVVRDISKRKDDEKALLLSQMSINTSKDAIVWFNKFGRILYVNNAAVEMFGYSKKEIYSLAISDIENNSEADFWQKRLGMLNKKGSHLFETVFRDKKRKNIPVEISISYYKYENDEFIFAAVRNISERKQAESKLRDSEKRFRDMAELLPQGVFECDTNGKVTYGNIKVLEMLQYTYHDIEKGFYVIDSLVLDDKVKASENIKLLFEGKARHPHEYNMIKKNGAVFPASIYSSLITDGEIPKGLRGIIVDLTEKRAGEKEKEERDSLFSLLFEKAGDANSLFDGKTFIDCNETMVKVFNAKSKQEILNKHPWELSPEFQPDGEKSSVKATKNIDIAFKEGSYRFEWVHLKYDGSTFFAEVVLTAIPIKGKWYLNASVRDITDKKITEQKEKIFYQRLEKLLEIERKILAAHSTEEIYHAALKHLRVILECHRASIVLFDKENDTFKVIAVDTTMGTNLSVGNSYALSTSPISKLEQGKCQLINDMSSVPDLLPVDADLYKEGVRSRVSVPIIINNEVFGALNLGSTIPNNFNDEKIQIAQDVSVSISLALQHSNLIDRINMQNAELEKRIDERTFQLLQTISELESFSYSVSHDLRAPLRSIGGFSQAIIDDYSDKLGEDGRSLLKRITSASQRMSDLIDALLKLAKITRSELVVEKLDISAIVSSVANELIRHGRDRTNVEIIVQPEMFAKGDHKLIRIAVENLLSNSLKFTQKKEKAIIEFGQTDVRGVKVFFIKDNGVGFDMEYSSKLFGAFQRLHNVDEFEGTGIGLATTKRIIQRHNGTIWADSVVGEGSIFYFNLDV